MQQVRTEAKSSLLGPTDYPTKALIVQPVQSTCTCIESMTLPSRVPPDHLSNIFPPLFGMLGGHIRKANSVLLGVRAIVGRSGIFSFVPKPKEVDITGDCKQESMDVVA